MIHPFDNSSYIEEIRYDSLLQELLVVFHTGAQILYEEVPKTIVDEFIEVDSPGTFLRENIQNKFKKSNYL